MIFPTPKPTGRGLGQKKSGKRKPIRARKSARPGRLKGKALEKLRTDCFERDRYLCCECGTRVYWTTGHMAHKRNKRMWGDALSQVQTECDKCHGEFHQYGPGRIKPVPPKSQGEREQARCVYKIHSGERK